MSSMINSYLTLLKQNKNRNNNEVNHWQYNWITLPQFYEHELMNMDVNIYYIISNKVVM